MANAQMMLDFAQLIDAGSPNYILTQRIDTATGVTTLVINTGIDGALPLLRELLAVASGSVPRCLRSLGFHYLGNNSYILKQSDQRYPNPPVNITIDSFAEYILLLLDSRSINSIDQIQLPALLADESLRANLDNYWNNTQGHSDQQRRNDAKNTIIRLQPQLNQQLLARQRQRQLQISQPQHSQRPRFLPPAERDILTGSRGCSIAC
ncbi:hypothetical protein [Xenorhabdus innexi]|uniref:Uncharacterized protein n=1 Tax=Xenorhabdus innexi TaxID=290109 RepID=A0A1N6MZI3_9GAMM|nr:hypothetical protein [Xenorhabdus innexi]PHM23952.1 hypothetical protein Xinn_04094 [Xenorhabdus innexi]SIP74179.1 hypothetical protein XIS1_550001 [Xenorhabdus innexi]